MNRTAFICLVVGVLMALTLPASAFYDSSKDVIQLTPENFDRLVIDTDEPWIIEFYAPWCGHCKSMVPEWKKAAKGLAGIVKVGAVDADAHQSLAAKYGVRGFPTIKTFGSDKSKPNDHAGERVASAFISSALRTAKDVALARAEGKSQGGSAKSGGSSGGGYGSPNEPGGGRNVVKLNQANFKEKVLDSQEAWMVEFYAPWCGHCKTLAPEWAKAADELVHSGVKLGAVDATVESGLASQFGVQGYPTIKVFRPGKKSGAEDYNGARTANDIVAFASELTPPPEVTEMINNEIFENLCKEKKGTCILNFVPHILDTNAKERNGYISTLKNLAEQHKGFPFQWLWAEGGQHMDFEEKLGVGGFGYPAVVAVNMSKGRYAVLRGAPSEQGIKQFIDRLQTGGEATIPVPPLPTLKAQSPWDGKDGTLPDEL
eukprot:Clim_evm30s128 gene=Clim_evmTU30s128